MKRAISIILFGVFAGLWLVPVASTAAGLKGRLGGGLKIGFALTDIHGSDVRDFPYYDDPDTSWAPTFGFCGGVFITVGLTEKAAIQAEALVSTKGSAQLGIYDVYAFKTTYLEIPVLMKFASTIGRSSASLFAGPALAILLSSGMTNDGEPIPFERFRSTDWGIVLGLDWAIRSRVVIDIRYTIGESKFIEMDGEPLGIKNTALALMVGYIF
jgi:Outer membrane protein beta-barrel domain